MLSPSRAEASAEFVDWLERMDSGGRMFLSVVTIHEIEKGIALLEHKGATAKAANLKVWLARLVAAYDDKLIAADTVAAALAGQLEAKAIAAGHGPGMADATIAGIAKAHDVVIVTRDTKQFRVSGSEWCHRTRQRNLHDREAPMADAQPILIVSPKRTVRPQGFRTPRSERTCPH